MGRRIAVVLLGGAAVAAPMTLEQVSELAVLNRQHIQELTAALAERDDRIDALEDRLEACCRGRSVPEAARTPSASTPTAHNEWAFTITIIEPQDMSEARTEAGDKLAMAASIREEADRRVIDKKGNPEWVHITSIRMRMKKDASELEREAQRLLRLVDDPPLLLRGVDDRGRDVFCECDPRLTPLVKRLKIDDVVKVRGELRSADTGVVEIRADRILAP